MNEPERLERCTTMVGGHMGGICGRHRGHDGELECRLPTSMEVRLWTALEAERQHVEFLQERLKALEGKK